MERKKRKKRKMSSGQWVLLVLDVLGLKRLLMFDIVDDGLFPILLAAAELEDVGYLVDLNGEVAPIDSLSGCEDDLLCTFNSSTLRALVVAGRGERRLFKALSLSP